MPRLECLLQQANFKFKTSRYCDFISWAITCYISKSFYHKNLSLIGKIQILARILGQLWFNWFRSSKGFVKKLPLIFIYFHFPWQQNSKENPKLSITTLLSRYLEIKIIHRRISTLQFYIQGFQNQPSYPKQKEFLKSNEGNLK